MTPTCPATIIPSTWIARIHRQAPVPSSLSHRDIGLLFDRDQQTRGYLRLRGPIVRCQGLIQRAVSGFVAWDRLGEVQPFVQHLLDQFGNGLGFQGILTREVVPYIWLAKSVQGLVEMMEEAIGLDVLGGRKVIRPLAELLLQAIHIAAHLLEKALIDSAVELRLPDRRLGP